MFDVLVEKLKSILVANEKIGIVYNHEARDLTGDPAAIVVPSENESDYNTTEENMRIYAFTIRLYVKRTKPRTHESADAVLRDLVGTVLDDFDKDYMLTGISENVPTGYTFINIFATPSVWGYAGEGEDEYRVAEINVRARVSVDLNSIS